MIPINSAIGVLVFLVGFALFTNIMLTIRVFLLYHRCIDILVCAYDWLEQARYDQRKEDFTHEGTD